jgi:hypothetical protein
MLQSCMAYALFLLPPFLYTDWDHRKSDQGQNVLDFIILVTLTFFKLHARHRSI